MKKTWMFWGGLGLCLIGWYKWHHCLAERITSANFEFAVAEHGDIVYEISATGRIQPINTVNVGTQVSGMVQEVLVDYNSEVKKGELLARLDSTLLVETVKDTLARLKYARAKETDAEKDFQRAKSLVEQQLIPTANYEDIEIALSSARAELLVAEAAYSKAKRNLAYADITSPVAGTVISREVEQGQTVAASLQAPTLFRIAENLTEMQIEANIAEADIGVIKVGMPVTFTVDAYPNKVFQGEIKQIRLSPIEEQNVVMYTVIIQVDNHERFLLPGMTAFIKIKIASAVDVLRVPILALHYHPNTELKKSMQLKKIADLKDQEAVVYQFDQKLRKLVPRIVTRGINDGNFIEICSGLVAGDQVVMAMVNKK